MKKLNKKTKIATSIVLLIGVFVLFTPMVKAEAFGQYFAGKVSSMKPCVESGGYQVIIDGRFGGEYLYEGADLYRHYHVETGKYVLGKYTSVATCIVSYYPTETLPVSGTITFVATS